MRHALSAMWSAIIVIFQGTEAFAQAFKAAGETVQATTETFRDEEVAKAKMAREKFEQEYQQLLEQKQ